MNKLLKVILATSIISSNIPYVHVVKAETIDNVSIDSTENSDVIENSNVIEDIETQNSLDEVEEINTIDTPVDMIQNAENNPSSEETSYSKTVQKIEVSDENELINALKQSNVEITLTSDITLTQKIENTSGQNKPLTNIVLNGGNHSLTFNGSGALVVKDIDGLTIKDIKLSGYTNNPGVKLYRSKNVTLDNVTFEGGLGSDGKTKLSSIGLDIHISTGITLKNITTMNHNSYGIRLVNGSQVTLEGNMVQSNDKIDLSQDDQTSVNQISGISLSKQYTSSTIGSTVQHTLKQMDVNTESDLIAAAKRSNITVDLQKDLELTQKIEFVGSNVIFNGNDHYLSGTKLANNEDAFVIKGKDNIVNHLIVKDYPKSGIVLYNAQGPKLNNVTLNGENSSTKKSIGLDVSGSKNVVLSNLITTANGITGIRVQKGSIVELNETLTQNNDGVDLQDVIVDNATNTISDLDTRYVQVSNTTNGTTQTVGYNLKAVEVKTEDELQAAVKKSGVTIELKNDLTLKQKVEVTGTNITINGNNYSLKWESMGNSDTFVIKGKNDTKTIVNDLTVQDYPKTGITLYQTQNVELNNVKLIGTNASNKTVGIDINQSTGIVLSNLTTTDNKTTGIRVQKGSAVELKGTLSQNNDGVDLQDVIVDNATNAISDLDTRYVQVSNTTNGTTQTVGYNLKAVEVKTEDELQAAVKKSGATIILTEDITLTKDIELKGTDITIDGQGHSLNLVSTPTTRTTVAQNPNSFQIKNASNVIVKNLKIANYQTVGLTIYKSTNVNLENVDLIGTAGTSTIGIDINESKDVILNNIKTSNHKTSGIRLLKGSMVTLQGKLEQQSDTVDLQDVFKDATNTINGLENYYVEVKNEADKVSYNLKTVEVTNEEELIVALTKTGSTVKLQQDITLSENVDIKTNNIALDGNQHTLTLNQIKDSDKEMFVLRGNGITISNLALKMNQTSTKNVLVVRGENATLKNLTIDGYVTNGITVYQAKNTTLENITLTGKLDGTTKQSNVGIDFNGATVTLKDITLANHKNSGIRMQNEASVTVEGFAKHENETIDLQIINKDGKDSTLIDTQNLYIEISQNTNNQNQTSINYKARNTSHVKTFAELQEAIKIPYHTIILDQDIQFTDNLEITQKNIVIDASSHKIDLNKQFSLTVKSENFELNKVQFENYNGTSMRLYAAKNAILKDVTFKGNDLSLDKEERSKIGLDITQSSVKLENITSSNHLYKGIQVRNTSNVEIISPMKHVEDNIHLQTITADGEVPSVINDTNKIYTHGSTYTDNNSSTVDYYIASSRTVSTVQELIDAVVIPGTTITLTTNLKVEESDLTQLNSDKQMSINKNVVVDGNGYTIDLNQKASLLLKGQDIIIKNVTIENSNSHGMSIYNSRNVLLENVTIQNSQQWGVFVNGSIVGLKNIKTLENTKGGIQITRSRTLRLDSHFDSYVEIIDTIYQKESNINVGVTNLEMLDGTTSNNQFIAPNNLYTRYENDTKYAVLSQYYLDLFEIKGEDRNKKYGQTEIDFMLNQQQIDVTTTQEVKDENGNVIQLKNDGVTDNADNLEKFIAYAALNGKTLYFPEGTYVISRDIDLSKLELPALSNFTLKGSASGLSILDGASQQGRMLRISNAEYHSIMNYVNFDNLVFNNIGIEINGPYKKGVSFTNNAFINGKYTAEYRSDGSIYKVTLEPYIHLKNNKYTVENNVFLRGDNYPGRGVATYRTTNTTLKNNYFGILDGLTDAAQMLPSDVITKATLIQNSGLLDGTLQGNFMTAINNERYDENVLIQNNYFNIDKTRNIIGDFDDTVLVSGINVATEGQRRDHIIYSKGYDGLNIVGNYFKGMENSAAGGVKIRNGNNAYIGSNYFNDVPLLTYIYGDLTKAETLLYDTVIYNNIFQSTTNFGAQGTGILYYQSFFDGDNLTYKSNGEVWNNAYGDVRNFIIYKNQFVGDERESITISLRAKTALNQNQFLASGNTYTDLGGTVNYNKGNATLIESTDSDILVKIPATSGYNNYQKIEIPLTPIKVDSTYLSELINKNNSFIQSLYDQDLVGSKKGQYSEASIQELTSLIESIQNQLKDGVTKQATINELYTKLETSAKSVKPNEQGDADEIPVPPTTNPDEDNNPGTPVPPTTNPDEDNNTGTPVPPTTNPDEDNNIGIPVPPTTNPDEDNNTGTPVPPTTNPDEDNNTGTPVPPTTNPDEDNNIGIPVPPTTNPDEDNNTGMLVPPTTNPDEDNNTGMLVPPTTNPDEDNNPGTSVPPTTNPDEDNNNNTETSKPGTGTTDTNPSDLEDSDASNSSSIQTPVTDSGNIEHSNISENELSHINLLWTLLLILWTLLLTIVSAIIYKKYKKYQQSSND